MNGVNIDMGVHNCILLFMYSLLFVGRVTQQRLIEFGLPRVVARVTDADVTMETAADARHAHRHHVKAE